MPVQRVRHAADVRAWLIYSDRISRPEAKQPVDAPVGAMRNAVARTCGVTGRHFADKPIKRKFVTLMLQNTRSRGGSHFSCVNKNQCVRAPFTITAELVLHRLCFMVFLSLSLRGMMK